ncbi:MAG: FecR domain-containing protein [Acidobacteria bacterium]|nr:FecR domain-containing protein [Acidobacteriota bacterium]
MRFKQHLTASLSAYCNGELSRADSQAVAEHLLACQRCRNEYDEIKLGVQLATHLPQLSAPASLWSDIENLLDAPTQQTPATKPVKQIGRSRFALGFGWQRVVFASVILFLLAGVGTVIYQTYFAKSPTTTVALEPAAPPFKNPSQDSVPPSIPSENSPLTPDKKFSEVASEVQNNKRDKVDENHHLTPSHPSTHQPVNTTTWEVARLAGSPLVGKSRLADKGKIAIGEWLETDNASRAQITVGEIGHVEVAPNTRIKMVEARPNEHRLQLAIGQLHAKIYAPPRLFFVDTPTAEAIDLGCEYTLEVDDDGTSLLRVQSGWVAFVRDGRESLVPKGARAITRKGFAPGTPFFEDASPKFKQALEKFDFEKGGKGELEVLIQQARARDTLTLWHLLSRVKRSERIRLFNRLVGFVPLPDIVTRAGILRLDKEMLRWWKLDLEIEW